VFVTPGHLSQEPNNVQSPHGERPRDEYGLEGVSWEVGLACIELAPFTGAYDLICIGDRCGSVEALAERVAHEGARCCVMAAHARVYVTDELPTMGDWDAPLQDPRNGVLIQLVVDHAE
jgi:hypothetical protein